MIYQNVKIFKSIPLNYKIIINISETNVEFKINLLKSLFSNGQMIYSANKSEKGDAIGD